jgi:hypothetical protein
VGSIKNFLELQPLKSISMKKIGIALFFALLANFVSAEVAKTINNLVAGTLSTVLTATEKATVTKLKVTGSIDARDFYCMRDEMTVLADVDLMETQIEANSGFGSAAGQIPANAFSTVEGKATLKSFVFPKWAASVGDGAFKNCTGLTSIKLDSCLSLVGKESFTNCAGLSSLTLSDCLSIIKPRAFADCISLTGTLMVPNAVRKIRDGAFNNCSKLIGVVFGSQVDSVGADAFDHCSELKTIRFTSERKTKLSVGTFYNIASGSTIFVPSGMISNYSNDTSWVVGVTTLYEYKARVSSQSALKQTNTSVKFTGSIDFITDAPINSYGFCWSKTSTTPTIMDSLIDNGTTSTLGNYFSIVNTLTPGTLYNIRAFVYDKYGVSYGKLIKYTTPILPVAAGTIVGQATVAQGQSGVTYMVPAITNATSYVWTLPSGATGTSTTNSITVSYSKTAVSGSISVFGRNANGDGAASTLNIVVNPLPKVAGAITGYSVVCQGEKLVSYVVPPIDNATSYVWSIPSGCTGSSTTNTILVNYTSVSVSGNISVHGKNDWGAGDSSTLAVTVHQVPFIEYYDVALTYGSSMTLAPKIQYTDEGTLKYKWTPSTGLDNDTIANPVVTVKSTIQYSLTVTTPYGCTITSTIRVSLKAMDTPAIGIVGIVNGKNRIAWNKPVSPGVESYRIYKETIVSDVYEMIGSVPYDSLSVFVDANSAPDVKSSKYKISVLDKGGVESPMSDAHKTMHLSINKGQNGMWNLIWEPYEGFKPATYNIYRGTSATNLNFLDATSGSSTQYSDLEAPATDVYYQLEVISPNLVSPTRVSTMLRSVMATYNSSRSNVVAGMANGLAEPTTTVRLYPNPVKDVLNIEMEGGTTFEISNLTGQVVFKSDLRESTVVNASSFQSGLYVVKIKVGSGFEFRKVMKVD